jgi:protein-tyrosine phosphatase
VLDLHTHLLHSIDDGPTDLQSSIEMIQLAAELGYTTLVATPHLLEVLDNAYDARVDERMRELEPHGSARGVSFHRGFEVRLTPDIGRRLQAGEPISLAGSRTVLVELPFSGWPIFTEHALFDVLASGFTPLLAHPERYEAAVEQPQRILDLHQRGVMIQVTTGSLAGLFGKRSRSLAEDLLRQGAVDVLASDAHSAGRRFVSVAEGLVRAKQIVGAERVRQLTVDNPTALLADRQLPPSAVTVNGDQPSRDRARSWNLVRNVLPRR